jgi:hypothetical protein
MFFIDLNASKDHTCARLQKERTCELLKNNLCPAHGLSTDLRIPSVCPTIPWLLQNEKLFLLGSVSLHCFRTAYVSREFKGYRNLSSFSPTRISFIGGMFAGHCKRHESSKNGKPPTPTLWASLGYHFQKFFFSIIQTSPQHCCGFDQYKLNLFENLSENSVRRPGDTTTLNIRCIWLRFLVDSSCNEREKTMKDGEDEEKRLRAF